MLREMPVADDRVQPWPPRETPRKTGRSPRTLSKNLRDLTTLRGFLWALLALTAINIAVELVCRFALGLPYPYNWPFVAPKSRFDDLLSWMPLFRSMHTQAFFHQPRHLAYPAPSDVVYWLFSLTGRWALAAYLALAALTAAAALALFGRALHRAGLATAAVTGLLAVVFLTSYPFWFMVHTANLELVVWILTMLGVWAFAQERHGWAATCFGLAASMKLLPIAYLLLFASRRRWLRGLQGLAVAIGSTLASLWMVCPRIGLSWRYMWTGSTGFLHQDGLARRDEIIGFDHSLLALLKVLLPKSTLLHPVALLSAYLAAVALAVLGLWLFRVRQMPLTNRVLFVVLVSIWLVPVSYDYTLLHLYAPWALLVLAIVRGRAAPGRAAAVALGCFAVAFTPQAYIIYGDTRYAAQAKAFALLALMAVAAWRPLELRFNLRLERPLPLPLRHSLERRNLSVSG